MKRKDEDRGPVSSKKPRASAEALVARQEAFEARGGISHNGPLYRFLARLDLKECRQQFEAGEKFALTRAIRNCAQHDLVMPEWVARGYIRAFDAVNGFRARSWDEVLGAPVPKGAHLDTLRKRRLLRLALPIKLRKFQAMGKSIDWVALAKELGSNKTTLQDLHYGCAKRTSRKFSKKTG
jgi:hypothetical protein